MQFTISFGVTIADDDLATTSPAQLGEALLAVTQKAAQGSTATGDRQIKILIDDTSIATMSSGNLDISVGPDRWTLIQSAEASACAGITGTCTVTLSRRQRDRSRSLATNTEVTLEVARSYDHAASGNSSRTVKSLLNSGLATHGVNVTGTTQTSLSVTSQIIESGSTESSTLDDSFSDTSTLSSDLNLFLPGVAVNITAPTTVTPPRPPPPPSPEYPPMVPYPPSQPPNGTSIGGGGASGGLNFILGLLTGSGLFAVFVVLNSCLSQKKQRKAAKVQHAPVDVAEVGATDRQDGSPGRRLSPFRGGRGQSSTRTAASPRMGALPTSVHQYDVPAQSGPDGLHSGNGDISNDNPSPTTWRAPLRSPRPSAAGATDGPLRAVVGNEGIDATSTPERPSGTVVRQGSIKRPAGAAPTLLQKDPSPEHRQSLSPEHRQSLSPEQLRTLPDKIGSPAVNWLQATGAKIVMQNRGMGALRMPSRQAPPLPPSVSRTSTAKRLGGVEVRWNSPGPKAAREEDAFLQSVLQRQKSMATAQKAPRLKRVGSSMLAERTLREGVDGGGGINVCPPDLDYDVDEESSTRPTSAGSSATPPPAVEPPSGSIDELRGCLASSTSSSG